MKYTNLSEKIGNIVLCFFYVFVILLLLVFCGLALWVDFLWSVSIYTCTFLFLLPGFVILINYLLGKIFGDRYRQVGWILEGESRIYEVIKTPKYCTRSMFVCFVESFLFVLLIIRFIFLFDVKDEHNIFTIIGLIGSIIGVIICFILAMRHYKQSSLRDKYKQKIEMQKNKQVDKFKFDKYPDLLEKYNAFKLWNSKKHTTFENPDEKKHTLDELEKALDSLALAVFNTFNEKKPQLVVKSTGEKVEWDEVINKPFEELSYMEKLILVRLLDRLYKYVLPKEYYDYKVVKVKKDA